MQYRPILDVVRVSLPLDFHRLPSGHPFRCPQGCVVEAFFYEHDFVLSTIFVVGTDTFPRLRHQYREGLRLPHHGRASPSAAYASAQL